MVSLWAEALGEAGWGGLRGLGWGLRGKIIWMAVKCFFGIKTTYL
jgi:hypothetical protein